MDSFKNDKGEENVISVNSEKPMKKTKKRKVAKRGSDESSKVQKYPLEENTEEKMNG